MKERTRIKGLKGEERKAKEKDRGCGPCGKLVIVPLEPASPFILPSWAHVTRKLHSPASCVQLPGPSAGSHWNVGGISTCFLVLVLKLPASQEAEQVATRLQPLRVSGEKGQSPERACGAGELCYPRGGGCEKQMTPFQLHMVWFLCCRAQSYRLQRRAGERTTERLWKKHVIDGRDRFPGGYREVVLFPQNSRAPRPSAHLQ